MVHPLLLQVHDVDQREKWSLHDRQRQLHLPHSEPRVSFPKGPTCPLIKHSIGWGELLFFLICVFLLDCNVLCHASFSCCFLKIHKVTCFSVDWNYMPPPSISRLVTFPILPLLCSLADNWHQLPNLRWENSMFQSDGRACPRRLTGKPSSMSWRNS